MIATNIDFLNKNLLGPDTVTIVRKELAPVAHGLANRGFMKKVRFGRSALVYPFYTSSFSTLSIIDMTGRCVYNGTALSPLAFDRQWQGIESALHSGNYIVRTQCADTRGRSLGSAQTSVLVIR
jgi:hypothetical protein